VLRSIWILYAGVSIYGLSGATLLRPTFLTKLETWRFAWPISSTLPFLPMPKQPPRLWVSRFTRSVTSGARVRQIPREEAEIALECLRDWGISARILEDPLGGPRS